MDSRPVPPNARLDIVLFDDIAKTLVVSLRGNSAERNVAPGSIAALVGARIRHESLTASSGGGGGVNVAGLAVTAVTGIPVAISKPRTEGKAKLGEELMFALGMRIDDVPELWYLLAASFNFRKALGPEATYSTDMNLRLFIRRLAAFAPQAVRDGFFSALLGGSALPPPLESLLEFFKITAVK